MDAGNVIFEKQICTNLRMKSVFFFSLSFSILIFNSCADSEKTSQAKSARQSLYEANCTSCHGEDGKLCVLGAKDLSVSSLSKEQMIEIITDGKSTMTPFGSVMSKEEVSQVADYVQTLKK